MVEKSVTWIELFFDLVFVSAAHNLALLLSKQDSLLATLPYVLLFIPIMWSWMTHTLFTNQFMDRQWFYHIFTFLQMLGIVALIIFMPTALTTHPQYFAGAYVLVKALLILQYLLASVFQLLKIIHILPIIVGNAGSGLLWALSFLSDNPIPWWIAAMVIDLLTPVFTKTRAVASLMDSQHLPERLGLLVVIVIGEMLLSLVTSMFGVDLSYAAYVALGIGIFVASSMFWVYFRFNDEQSFKSTSRIYIYSHIPLVLGIIFIAAGYKEIFGEISRNWLLAFGMTLFLLAFVFLNFLKTQRFLKRHISMIVVLVFCNFILNFLSLSPFYTTIVLSAGFVIYLSVTEMLLFPRASSGDRSKWS